MAFGIFGCADVDPDAADADPRVEQAAQPVQANLGLRIRKDAKDLSQSERNDLVHAIWKLKNTSSPYDSSLSYYDQFVAWHVEVFKCGSRAAHGSPIFLPWHREFLRLFEDALSEVSGKKITVPYWDWTNPASTAAVFQENFMGGDGDPNEGYALTKGPFRKGKWHIDILSSTTTEASRRNHIVRHLGWRMGPISLPTVADVQAALAIDAYDVYPYNVASDHTLSFRNNLEGFHGFIGMTCEMDPVTGEMRMQVTPGPNAKTALHNVVHGWVGGMFFDSAMGGAPVFGTMTMDTSPNDPVFFMHHANIDRIWDEWQRLHGIYSYQPVSGGRPGINRDDPMWPYDEIGLGTTPGSVEDVQDLGYVYQ